MTVTKRLSGVLTDAPALHSRFRLPMFSGISESRHAKVAYHCMIFPNVFFSVYPDHFFRVIVDPITPDRSIERATLFTSQAALAQPASEDVITDMFKFWDNVNTEDITICEAVQVWTVGRFRGLIISSLHYFTYISCESECLRVFFRYRKTGVWRACLVPKRVSHIAQSFFLQPHIAQSFFLQPSYPR